MKTSYSDNNDTSASTDREKALKPKTREVGDKVTNATTDPKIQTPLKPPFRSAKQMEEKNLEEESNKTAATVTPFKHSETPTGTEDGFFETSEEDAELNQTENEEPIEIIEIFDYEGGSEEDVNGKGDSNKDTDKESFYNKHMHKFGS